MIIVISKQLGFSFDELNELTIQDLLDIANIHKSDSGKPKKKKATQADINKFTGWRPKS